MTDHQLLRLLEYVWTLFGLYWVAVARGGKATQTGESPFYRLLRLLILVITFTLLFSDRTAVGFLAQRFIPQISAFAYAGFAATVAGLAIALWARVHLGQYWSDKIVLKVDHQLIRTGPYAYMRHPIYSGVLLGVLGTALVVGQWRGVLAFLLLLSNYAIKAKTEDRILGGRFGAEFQEHVRRGGFLLPRFRRRM
jgi:protein-S-isoprenylcysteine O-methyltransferase Ste14